MIFTRLHRNRQTDRSRKGFSPITNLVVCGALAAALITFGYPMLWTAHDEAAAPARFESNDTSIVSAHTSTGKTEHAARAENLRMAAEALDGQKIAPGATFSFNSLIGDVHQDGRYLPAPVIERGGVVERKGGGLCQVSTTLYLAAVKADLQIVERHADSMVCDFAAIGLDAYVAYGSADLRIKNTSSQEVTISASATGQKVTVAFSGKPQETGRSVEVVSKVTSPAGVGTVEIEPSGKAVQMGDTSQQARPREFTVEVSKVQFKNGVQESSTLITTDTYRSL